MAHAVYEVLRLSGNEIRKLEEWWNKKLHLWQICFVLSNSESVPPAELQIQSLTRDTSFQAK